MGKHLRSLAVAGAVRPQELALVTRERPDLIPLFLGERPDLACHVETWRLPENPPMARVRSIGGVVFRRYAMGRNYGRHVSDGNQRGSARCGDEGGSIRHPRCAALAG